ncbi:hypothetical protein [Rubritalea tangerina]
MRHEAWAPSLRLRLMATPNKVTYQSMQHPDPNRKKEPCKDKCTACKNCQERAKLASQLSKPTATPQQDPK